MRKDGDDDGNEEGRRADGWERLDEEGKEERDGV